MRIVDRGEFLKLPEGTVYSLFKPCFFDGLLVKVSPPGQMSNDWLYDDLVCPVAADDAGDFADTLFAANENPLFSVPLDFNYTGRDGSFDDNQKFAIYETDDVRALIKRLNECLTKGG